MAMAQGAKRTQPALMELRLLAKALGRAPVALFIVRNRRIEYVNGELERLLRCKRRHIVGKPVSDFFRDPNEFVVRRRWAMAPMLRLGSYDYEALLQRRDGTVFWARVTGKTLTPSDPLRCAVWCLEELESAFRDRPKLSPRQRDVAIGVAQGLTNKQIGARLSLSPRTVEMHRARLMRKLGVRNITSLLTALEH